MSVCDRRNVFLTASLNLLAEVGDIHVAKLQDGLGWEGTFASIIVLYIVGNVIVNRRYR